jgi:nucleoside-diphosphate-sugar epimerase
MFKVALIGANGQVGAELAQLLAAEKEISLVPICRNRSGSAFLRWRGIACRHGQIAEAADAARLIGDCDVIVNCALATGTPAQIRRTEDRIVSSLFEYSPPAARIIHFSTQSVYGDPAPGRIIRWRNPYGRAKLATERCVRRAAAKSRKPWTILRLGHVCGALQEISNMIRTQIRTDTALLPPEDCSSNTVYTVAIVDALLRIMRTQVGSGTYDLMNTPRWTWREVYAYEARTLGLDWRPPGATAKFSAVQSRSFRLIASFASRLAQVQWLRELFSKLFVYLPEASNARAMAWWYKKRAAAEIVALVMPVAAPEHLSWVENGRHFFPAGSSTAELLERSIESLSGRGTAWPEDLPDSSASHSLLSPSIVTLRPPRAG